MRARRDRTVSPNGGIPHARPPRCARWTSRLRQPTHADGTFDHDRAGRPKSGEYTCARTHRLRHSGRTVSSTMRTGPGPPAPPPMEHHTTKLDDRADDVALALARAGCVGLEHDYRSGTICHPPRGWAPHPDLHAARQEQNSQRAARRAAQDDEARRLAAELTHNPAAGPLVAILSAQRDGPYRDHVIEAARALLTDDTTTDAGGAAPWAAVQWLKRGTKADYDMDHEPLAEGGQGAVYSGSAQTYPHPYCAEATPLWR